VALVAMGFVITVMPAHAAGPAASKSPAKAAASAAPAKAAASAATAAEPRRLTSGKLGDFDSGDLVHAGVGWREFQFAQGANKPTVQCSIVDGTPASQGNKVLHFEGKIPDDAQIAFMGVGCGFGGKEAAPPAVDMSGFKGIRFKVRGDENPYRLALLSAAVKDHNYHGKNFVAEKDWKSIDVPFSELTQTQGWGTPVEFTAKDVTVVSFSTSFMFTGPAWFEIDDVELYK
jgi:hypothetical protein